MLGRCVSTAGSRARTAVAFADNNIPSGGSHDSTAPRRRRRQYVVPLLRPAVRHVAPPVPVHHRGGGGGRLISDLHRDGQSGASPAASARPADPDQRRLRALARPGGRRFRSGRRADRERQDLRGAAEHQRAQCRGHRCVARDRGAGFGRYPPSHVAGHSAQCLAGRFARRLYRDRAEDFRGPVRARRCLCR